MNYETAKAFKEKVVKLSGTPLIKSKEWSINNIIILPSNEDLLLIYIDHISMYNPNWMATSFNQEFIYKQSGIYFLYDGRVADDNLTLYATLFNKKSNTDVNYKCELLYNLIVNGEVIIEDNQDLLSE